MHDLFADRRQRFFAQMQDGIAILPGGVEKLRNNDCSYAFRQLSDFYYLTGFEEPDAFAVFIKDGGQTEYILFVPPKDRAKEIWTGWRAGVEGAVGELGATEAFKHSEFDAVIPGLIAGKPVVYLPLSSHEYTKDQHIRLLNVLTAARRMNRVGGRAAEVLRDPQDILHEMRLHKSAGEVALMREACRISGEGHVAAMRAAKPGMNERQLVAVLDFVYRKNGSARDGYESIVAGGANACVLHYIENNRDLQAGDLCLIDSGAEYEYYSGDITRTFPIGGQFSPEQKAIYEVVLAANEAVIEICKPGTRFGELNRLCREVLIDGLLKLGVLKGDAQSLLQEDLDREAKNKAKMWKRRRGFRAGDDPQNPTKDEAEKDKDDSADPSRPSRLFDFYMHGVGHWLGMDVHDRGHYYETPDTFRELTPGMVFTVEPGLYIGADDPRVDPKWRGIGVRIEDNILITETGHENMTAATPKSVADVEACCAEPLNLNL